MTEGVGGLEGVIAAAKQAPGRGLPPVHLWNPAHCGEIDIVIKRNGLWFHEGTPIGREALVRLFSTVLRKDPEGYVLVTPVEKLAITVEDAPFIAVRVDRVGEALRFVTNVGDVVEAGPDNAIRVRDGPRDRRAAPLSARAPRARGADRAAGVLRTGGDGRGARYGRRTGHVVSSNGAWFEVGPVETGPDVNDLRAWISGRLDPLRGRPADAGMTRFGFRPGPAQRAGRAADVEARGGADRRWSNIRTARR